ncbi:MAG: hypothetical protein EOO45_09165, partial [Flavobacterium sp.]
MVKYLAAAHPCRVPIISYFTRMLINMHGQRSALIKVFANERHQCKNCHSLDLDIRVYRDYHHFAMIPFAGAGDKTAKIYCNHCGEGLRTESVRREYEKLAKTPWWFYLGFIFIALAALVVTTWLYINDQRTDKYVSSPQSGDIYKIKESTHAMGFVHFLRVNRVTADSVYFFPGDLVYLDQSQDFS